MYRAPEMLDLYQNFPINQQADLWVSTAKDNFFIEVKEIKMWSEFV